jgi:cytochrome P450
VTRATDEPAEYPVAEFTHRTGHKEAPLTHFSTLAGIRDMPCFRSTFGPGFWVFTRMSPIRGAFQQPTIFSSAAVVETEPEPPYRWIPEMLDPPEHTRFRQLLAPRFAPGRVAAMERRARERCVELLEAIAPRGECDFLEDFSRKYPTSIFMELMGLPVAEADKFLDWQTAIATELRDDPTRSRAMQAMNEVTAYFAELIELRRAEPRDDLVSYMLRCTIDDEPIEHADLLAVFLLLFNAGLDTVTQQLAYSFFHLATHADDREQIVADPSVIPTAIEEFLRYYAIVAPARKVVQDADVGGCPVRTGDMVFLPICTANRDPDVFGNPDDVQIGREPNPHIAFGAGPHRCLGSHLARLEMRVALEEWHQRIPDYELRPGAAVLEHGGSVMGLENLPLVWSGRTHNRC